VPTYQFNVIFKGLSGLPKDQYVNTWHFYQGDPDGHDFDNVRDMLKDFYSVAPAGSPLRTHMPAAGLQTTVSVKAYDMDDEKPRAPAYESSWGPETWGAGTVLPQEVAYCFSFQAGRESGEIQSRRRNRVYLGPFRSTVTDTNGRPSSAFMTDVLNAGKRLHDAAAAAVYWSWKVYSPTNNEIYDVDHLWVDDAWDTQRRRGMQPTARVQFQY
jgi:hypothetical protein